MNTLAEMMLQNTLVAAPVALLVAVGSRFWRRPAVTHFLWALVLLKLLTPPLVTIPIEPLWTTDAAGPVARAGDEMETLLIVPSGELTETILPYETAGNEPAVEASEGGLSTAPALAWFLGVSLAGSVGYFVILGSRVRQFAGLLRSARPAPASIAARSQRLCRAIGLRRCPAVQLVPGQAPPSVWGWGRRTRILMPAGLFERLDARAQDTLLIHELAHVRRRDHWIRLLEIVATGLYWWNPVVWFARRELHEAEEQCCDRQVLKAFPGASRTYASALVDTVDFLSGARFAVPPTVSAAGPTRSLRRRIEMVMCGTDVRSWSWMSRLAVAVAALLLLPLGATWAENGEQKQDEQVFMIVGTGDDAPEGKAAGQKVGTRTVVVTKKGEGQTQTFEVEVPASVEFTKVAPADGKVTRVTGTSVMKMHRKKLKSSSRPISVTITYEDGSTEKLKLGEYDSLTINAAEGEVSMSKRGKMTMKAAGSQAPLSLDVRAPLTEKLKGLSLRGLRVTEDEEAGTLTLRDRAPVAKDEPANLFTRRGTSRIAREKKDTSVEDRLERLEQMLMKLQEEIKALKE